MNRKIIFAASMLFTFTCMLQAAAPLLSIPGLKWKWGKQAVIERTESTIKITTQADNETTGVSAPPFTVTPGGVYRITFEARGNVKLEAMMTWSKGEEKAIRHDYLKPTVLSGEWQKFSAEVKVPADKDRASTAVFFYRQSGWLEVKDFRLEAVETEN